MGLISSQKNVHFCKMLDAKVKEVAPIEGVGVGTTDDKSTWSVCFKPEATQEQRSAAQAVVDVFDINQPLPEPVDEMKVLQERLAALEAKLETQR